MASKEEKQELAAMAGTTVAFFNSNTELKKLFNKALEEGWTADRLLAASKNTKWFKTHSSPEREAQVLRYSDPDEYNRRVQSTYSQITALASTLGVPISYGRRMQVAKWAFATGANEEQIRRYLSSFNGIYQAVRKGGQLGGQLGQTQARLNQAMRDNGVKVSGGVMGSWLQRVGAGVLTEEHALREIQKKAISAFPGLKEQIESGMTVREFADQYIESMAELLELNSAEIDVFDKDIKTALNSKDAKGKFSPMTLSDFETRMRKDKRWMKTKNARETLMNAGHEVLRAWGVTW